jgi:hypothetical protein
VSVHIDAARRIVANIAKLGGLLGAEPKPDAPRRRMN